MGNAVTVRGHLADPRHIELDRDVTDLVGELEVILRPVPDVKIRRSIVGLGAHLGPAPSAEEIDEARREMWAGFPRDIE